MLAAALRIILSTSDCRPRRALWTTIPVTQIISFIRVVAWSSKTIGRGSWWASILLAGCCWPLRLVWPNTLMKSHYWNVFYHLLSCSSCLALCPAACATVFATIVDAHSTKMVSRSGIAFVDFELLQFLYSLTITLPSIVIIRGEHHLIWFTHVKTWLLM